MMFSRALALLDKIQERLALDRGSALSRALAERGGNSATAKPDVSTVSPSIQAGTTKTALVDQPSESQPVKLPQKRKRKPAKTAAMKSKRGKVSAQTPSALPSGKTGK